MAATVTKFVFLDDLYVTGKYILLLSYVVSMRPTLIPKWHGGKILHYIFDKMMRDKSSIKN